MSVPFVVTAVVLVSLMLLVGIISVTVPSTSISFDFIDTITTDLLRVTNQTMSSLSSDLGNSTQGLISALDTTLENLMSGVIVNLRRSFRKQVWDDGFELMETAASHTAMARTNITTLAAALQTLSYLVSEEGLSRYSVVQVHFGVDYSVNMRGDTFDDPRNIPTDVCHIAMLYYPPITDRIEAFRKFRGRAALALWCHKNRIPEMLQSFASNGSMMRDPVMNPGLLRERRLVNTSSDPAGYAAATEDAGNGNRWLYPVDDPNFPYVVAYTFYDLLEKKIVPGSDCAEGLEIAGSCWIGVDMLTPASSMSYPNLFSLQQKLPKAITYNRPFSQYTQTWMYMRRFLTPSPVSVYQGVDPVEVASVSSLATYGEVMMTGSVIALQPLMKSIVDQSGFASAFGVAMSGDGYIISASDGKFTSGGDFDSNVTRVSEALPGKNHRSSALWLYLKQQYGSLANSSLGLSATKPITFCIPGILLRLSKEFQDQFTDIRNLVDVDDHPGNFTDPETGRHAAFSTCDPLALKPNDTFAMVLEVQPAGRDYFNNSHDVFQHPNASAIKNWTVFAYGSIYDNVVLALTVDYQESHGVSSKATVEAINTINSAYQTISAEDVRSRARIRSKQSELYNVVIAVTVAIILLVVLVSGLVFYFAVRPLRWLLLSLHEVESFDLECAADSLNSMKTIFTEFDKTKTGVQVMISRLTEYRRFLPEWLVAQEAGIEEHDDESRPTQSRVEQKSQRGHISARRKSVPSGSSRNSQNISTARSAAHEVHAAPQSVSATGVESKGVTCLIVELDFSRAKDLGPVQFTALLNNALSTIEPLVRRAKGTMSPDLLSSSSTSLVVSILFNAQIVCRLPVTAALDCAISISSRLPLEVMQVTGPPRCGVYYSKVLSGPIGTNSQRWYVSLGGLGMTSRALAKFSGVFGVVCFTDREAVGRATQEQSNFDSLSFPPISLTPPSETEKTAVLQPVVVAQRMEQESDEWMYMLEEAENTLGAQGSVSSRCTELCDILFRSISSSISVIEVRNCLNAVNSQVSQGPGAERDAVLFPLAELLLANLQPTFRDFTGSFSYVPASVGAYAVRPHRVNSM